MAKYQLTQKQIKHEFIKCGKDVTYFINNYVKISHKKRGVIPFALYPFQEEILLKWTSNRHNILLKARQMGMSTLVSALALWILLYKKEQFIFVMAIQEKTSKKIVAKVKRMYDLLPPWMKKFATVLEKSQTNFKLSTHSAIEAGASADSAGRAEAISLLIVDEAAHPTHNMDLIWESASPALSSCEGGSIVLSTPKGAGNWYHQQWQQAISKQNKFVPHKLMWYEHPEHDDAWFKEETFGLKKRQIAQEFLCNFNASGDTFISPEDIEYLQNNIKDPIWMGLSGQQYWKWEQPSPSKNYIVSCDTSRGDGDDYTTAHVIDLGEMEQVAEYKSKIMYYDFAPIAVQIATEYNNALLLIENNNIGYEVLRKIESEIGYSNLYYSKKGTHEYVEAGSHYGRSDVIFGFTTSMKTRPLILAKLEEFVSNKILKINSVRTVDEMTTFVWVNHKAQAQKNFNDDLVTSLATACWVRDTAIIQNSKSQDYKRAMISAIYVANTKLDIKLPGQQGYKVKYDGFKHEQDEKKRKKEMEHLWVLRG